MRRLLAVLVVVAVCGCDSGGEVEAPAPPAPPDVLLISVDTLRRDHLSAYGYERPTSPRLRALAEEGVLFTNVVSPSSWTLPAHASMLTGLYPARHGLQDDGVQLAPEIPTLAESMGALGYTSLAVVSHVYVSSQFGLDRGFQHFDDSLIQGGATNPIGSQVVDRVLSRVDALGPEPLFAFVHFFDPHWNYSPPPPFDTRFTDPAYTGPVDGTLDSLGPFFAPDAPMPEADRAHAIALYDGEIAYVDQQIGRLIDGLRERGRLANGIVVVTADHGEEFKEHGQLGHARTLFGEQLRVPLIVSGLPDSEPGTRRNDLATPIDIAPTLLAAVDGAEREDLDGRSLLQRGPADRRVFAETKRAGREIRVLRQGRHKLIHDGYADARYFYDLASDPFERKPSTTDPSGGSLTNALDAYSEQADAGWHVKLIALDADALSATLRIETTGRLVDVRRHAAQQLASGVAEFDRFELAPDGRSLLVEATVSERVAEVIFETEPPDSPVTFRAEGTPPAPLYAGSGDAGALAQSVTLEPNDPRLGRLPEIDGPIRGVYVRSVAPRSRGAPAELSEEARARLEALGYTQD